MVLAAIALAAYIVKASIRYVFTAMNAAIMLERKESKVSCSAIHTTFKRHDQNRQRDL